MFVFQHSLSAVTNRRSYSIGELLQDPPTFRGNWLGHVVLFKKGIFDKNFHYGQMVIDPDNLEENEELDMIQFPVAEYHFAIHDGSFETMASSYSMIEKQLEEENLNATNHPLLVFPRGLPQDTEARTFIEVWTPTDANYKSEIRRSERLPEALPRRRYNFYTW